MANNVTTEGKATKVEEIRPITITNDETKESYVLEFNAKSVAFAESRGFNLEKYREYQFVGSYDLFFYALRMHHSTVSREKSDALLEKIKPLPEGFWSRLIELYCLPQKSMFVPAEDGEERKNSAFRIQL